MSRYIKENQGSTVYDFCRFMLIALTTVSVLCSTLPIVSGYFGSMPQLFVTLLGFLFLFPIKREYISGWFLTACLALAFFVCQALVRVPDYEFFVSLYMILRGVFVVSVAVLFSLRRDYKAMRFLFWVTVISISITQITTIINIKDDTDLARFAITGAAKDNNRSTARLNIGGYTLAYMSPVVTILMYALKKSKIIHPLLLIAHAVLTVVFIIKVQFTAALIIYVMVLISLLISRGNLRALIPVAVSLIILGFVLRQPLSNLFEYIAENTDRATFAERFRDLARAFRGEDLSSSSDISIRLRAYTTSINTFFKFFLTGSFWNDAKIGKHSAVLDYIAKTGLIGATFLVLMFKNVYKYTVAPYKGIRNIVLIYFAQVVFFIYAIINVAFYPAQIWILIGLSTAACMMISQKEKETEFNKIKLK